MILKSVDPGLRTCGVALWRDGVLTRADLVLGSPKALGFDAWYPMALAVGKHRSDELAIELPQVYTRGLSKGDPNDLIQLAVIVGMIADSHPMVSIYLPRQWKGQTPKDVMTRRIKGKLTDEELACIVLPTQRSLQHNVWDAIGIGLHHLERL